MAGKTVSLLGAYPVHPGRGEPSHIELKVVLNYLKGGQIGTAVLTPGQAIALAERLLAAVRSTADIS